MWLESPITALFATVLLAAIAIAVATRAESAATAVNILLVAAWTVACYGAWKWLGSHGWRYVAAAWLALGAGGFLLSARLLPRTEPVQAPTATLLARHVPERLPIRVAPGTTAYVLQLSPKIRNWLFPVRNDDTLVHSWPDDMVISDAYNGEPISVVELTNPMGERAMLEVELTFPVGFYELIKIHVQVTKNPDGTYSASWPTRGKDGHSFVRGKPPSMEGFTQGDLVASFDRKVTIPAIPPGATVKIYAVNQSQYIAGFKVPSGATSVISGHKSSVKLITPKTTVLDILPEQWLEPPRYHWRGVPDAP